MTALKTKIRNLKKFQTSLSEDDKVVSRTEKKAKQNKFSSVYDD